MLREILNFNNTYCFILTITVLLKTAQINGFKIVLYQT